MMLYDKGITHYAELDIKRVKGHERVQNILEYRVDADWNIRTVFPKTDQANARLIFRLQMKF